MGAITADIEQAVLTAATIATAFVGGWLVVSVAGWAVTIRLGRPHPATWQRLAMPGARRLAEAIFGTLTLVLSACSPPAATSSATPTLTLLEPSTGPTIDPEPPTPASANPSPTDKPSPDLPTTEPATTEPPTTEPPPVAPPPVAPPPNSPPTGANSVYVVQAGESFWSIARDLAEDRIGRPPTEPETAQVWRALLELNRDRIRSGDVDLIHPGEDLLVTEAVSTGRE